MKRIWIFLIVALVLSAGCVRRPKGVLSDKKMIPVLADMEIAEGYLHHGNIEGNREQTRDRLLAGILDAHHIKRADFDSTMKWYGENPDVYYKLGPKVSGEIDKRARAFAGEQGNVVIDNGNNLWPYLPMAYVDGRNGSEVLRFSLPGADVTPGEILKWKVRLRKEADATMLLGVDYTNGSSGYLSQRLNGRKNVEVELQTDSALEINRVFGHISFSERDDLPLWMDSISLTAIPFDSTKYFNINRQRLIHQPMKRVEPKPISPDSI